ncbi:isochorismatase family protein [Tatumella sp. JGM118]|uniref:isochorismatase family protein n=1 Tax=Tatumella sp. JGM118 TaxID=2799796 RepID=UPI001BAEA6C9|nr:isochorismatase family protein [Tatumella sp. JGM118]MBS0910470.1 isochorismatase family protein [Tatumella sp. JGM118]
MKNVLVVIDMQSGVLAVERFQINEKIALINQLIDAADEVIFIRHCEGEMQPGTLAWQIAPAIIQPENARYVSKTACDGFFQTTLARELNACGERTFTVCGCATDYCVDTTIKAGASLGYAITVAGDAHTTAERTFVSAQQLICHHNEVWAGLIVPGHPVQVAATRNIIRRWVSADQVGVTS